MTYGTRFNNYAQPALTIDAIRRVAPSAFAETKHESRTGRYTYIPTITVIEGLIANGFQPFSAVQSITRDEGKQNFAKHLIRLRRQDASLTKQGDSLPEVVLINSHDGTSAYKLFAGLFRLVCTNGLIVADGTVNSISVPHKGNIVDRVIEGSIEIVGQTEKALEKSREWSGLQLTNGEQQAYAKAAIELRFPSEQVEIDGEVVTRSANTIRPDQLLQTRRYDDNGNDLWKTFNRVQENVVRGNLRGRTIDGDTGRVGRRIRTREVSGINQNVGLNRALWTLTEELAKLKTAA